MAKKKNRSKPRRPPDNPSQRAARAEAQMLARAVRQQKRIRTLSKQLITATAAADDALRHVGRMALEREQPGQPLLELDAALHE
jgi:hypothetical protein